MILWCARQANIFGVPIFVQPACQTYFLPFLFFSAYPKNACLPIKKNYTHLAQRIYATATKTKESSSQGWVDRIIETWKRGGRPWFFCGPRSSSTMKRSENGVFPMALSSPSSIFSLGVM